MELEKIISVIRDYAAKEQYSMALEELACALKLTPNNIALLYLKALIYLRLDNDSKAEECLLEALSYSPDDVDVLIKLCDCYFRQKKYHSILEIAEKVKAIDPTNIYVPRAYGLALKGLDKVDESIAALKHGLSEHPNDIAMMLMLADIYFTLWQYDDAVKYYEVIYELDSKNITALRRLAFCGMVDEHGIDRLTRSNKLSHELLDIIDDKISVAKIVQDVALTSLDWNLQAKLGSKSDLMKVHRALVFQQSRIETMQDRFDLLEAHRVWGRNTEDSIDKSEIKRKARSKLNNKIRLGLISAGFRNRHIGHYMWPLVNNLNKDKFEIYCYTQFPQDNDRMQDKFEQLADSFKKCHFNNNSKDVAQIIANDSLDVLIEVGAWHSNPEVIAYRPAPMQISWLDYLHSMGLPTAIDYIITDPYINPEDRKLLIEKPLILPEVWMVMDKVGFPPVPITESTAEDRNGYITFGTMSRPHRFTEETFRVWAGIMNIVPNSKFIYIRPETKAEILRDNFCKNMEKHGISRDRIMFIAVKDNFMEYFNKIDIALDTFPDIGNTTTCYTLWMGLPLVTLVGPCFFERVSYSALNNCGLGDLCAFNLQEYQDIALSLVADKERRRYIRRNLRNWILNSPLGQSKRFADNMGNAIMNVLGRG